MPEKEPCPEPCNQNCGRICYMNAKHQGMHWCDIC